MFVQNMHVVMSKSLQFRMINWLKELRSICFNISTFSRFFQILSLKNFGYYLWLFAALSTWHDNKWAYCAFTILMLSSRHPVHLSLKGQDFYCLKIVSTPRKPLHSWLHQFLYLQPQWSYSLTFVIACIREIYFPIVHIFAHLNRKEVSRTLSWAHNLFRSWRREDYADFQIEVTKIKHATFSIQGRRQHLRSTQVCVFKVIQNWEADALQFYSKVLIFC